MSFTHLSILLLLAIVAIAYFSPIAIERKSLVYSTATLLGIALLTYWKL